MEAMLVHHYIELGKNVDRLLIDMIPVYPVPLRHLVQVGSIQSIPPLLQEPFLQKGCLRSTPRVSSSHHAARKVCSEYKITHESSANVADSGPATIIGIYYETI